MKIRDLTYRFHIQWNKLVIRRLLSWAASSLPYTDIDGIQIVNGADEDKTSYYFEKIKEILLLIEEYDLRTFESLKRSLSTIQIDRVIRKSRSGMYVGGTRRCFIAPRVLEGSVINAAAVLVHEGMHARLDAISVRQSTNRLSRVEQFCLESEIRFVERLPQTDETKKLIVDRKKLIEYVNKT